MGSEGVPLFITDDCIELEKIGRISLFRSSEGHDNSDDFESCRSMKHYFETANGLDRLSIALFSPVDGEVVRIIEEWAGNQIQIQPDAAMDFMVVIFHVNLKEGIGVGTRLTSGEALGHHIGNETTSDIAVGRNSVQGYQLISYFEVMPDDEFRAYQARGAQEREDLLLSREARDADPLTCDGEQFTSRGSLPSWFDLN